MRVNRAAGARDSTPGAASFAAMRRALVLLALAGVLAGAAAAQPGGTLSFERFGIREGLSNEHVLAMAQDSLGFLWVGTRDGLNRYDGHGFRTYRRSDSGLPGREVRALAVDQEDRLWVGTERGAALLDRRTGRFRRVRLPGGEGVAAIWLAVDREGGVWVGTLGRGLYYRAPGGDRPAEAGPWHRVPVTGVPHHDASLKVHGLLVSAEGVWVEIGSPAASPSGLVDPRKGMTHTLLRSRGSLIGPDQDRQLALIRSRLTLAGIDPQPGGGVRQMALMQVTDGATPFGAFAKVGQGRWWLPSSQGIIEWDRTAGTSRRIRAAPGQRGGLGSDDVVNVFRDQRGGVWVGTTSGLYLHRRRALPFRTYRRVRGDATTLSDDRVNGLAVGTDGRLWVATNGGMNRLDLDTGLAERLGLRVEQTVDLRDAFWSVAVTRAGDVYIGPKQAAPHRLRGGRLELVEAAFAAWGDVPDASPAAVRGLTEDRRGRIWAAFSTGLLRLDPDGSARGFGMPGADRGLTDGRTNTVYQASDGRLWVGTDSGLFLYDERRERVRFVAQACGPSVWSITETPADPGALWTSTFGGGLARIDLATGRVACVDTEDGLPTDLVYGLVADLRGVLWASTTAGLARVEVAAGGDLGRVSVYGAADGLQGDDHSFMSQLRLPDGRLAFGGPAGLTVFDPTAIARRSGDAPTAFTGVEVLGRFRDGVPLPGDTLRLRHDQNGFALRFATLDFRAPGRHRYRYRLVGLDDDWRETDASAPRAAYTEVPPGTYRFEVVGATHRGDEGGTPAALTVEVVPAWWQTWWARLALVLAAAGALAVGVVRTTQRRVAAVEGRRRESEEVQRRLADGRERERRRLARDLHDGPVQGLYRIGHDLDALERVAGSKAADIRETRGRLGAISGELREMLTQLRPTLALHLPLPDALDALANRFERRHAEVRVETVYETTADGADDAARLALFRITQEALENVARHAHARHVTVTLTSARRELRLRVEDDGRGFDVPERLVAFAREAHYGLVGMAERAEAVGGRFRVSRRDGGGTMVEAVVPCETPARTV